jgi:HEAT repeat protein
MEMPLEKNAIEAVTLLSVVYLVITFVLPETQILLWLMALLIVFNYGLSLTYLFRQGKITVNITLLNIVQLALFCRLHALIYDLLGAGHYSYALPPYWYDWVELVAVHVLRAVDLLDALGAYGIHLQNVKHQSTLTGIALFSMHIMVDIFLLGTLFMLINRRSATKQASTLMNMQRFVERFKGTLDFLKRSRIWGLGVAIVLIITVGITNDWHLINWLLWPLDNILRTLDFGDAFQIFDWQLHSLEMGLGLATLAVFFRLVVGFYAFGPANRFYLYLLGGRGKTLEELARICTSPEFSEDEIDIAFKALLRFDDSSVIPHLVTVLEGGQLHFRRLAAETLEKMGTTAVTAVPHLVSALVDSDNDVRGAAFDALEKIAPQWRQSEDAQSAIPHLVKALVNSESDIQRTATEVLGKIGPSAMIAIPPLVEVLVDSSDGGVIRVTTNALKKIDPQWRQSEKTQSAISHQVKALVNSDSDVRKAAADVLEKIDSQWRQSEGIQSAIPHLVKALVNSDSDVRKAAADVLEKIDSQWRQSEGIQSTIPHLVKALVNSDSDVRKAAADALGKIGPTAVKAVLHLVKALANSDKNSDVRKAAADALGKIGPTAVKAVPHLVKALANSDSDVRKAAADVLEKIDPQWRQSEGIQSAILHLVKALDNSDDNSDNSGVSKAAADALGKIGPTAVKAVPHLVKTLANSDDKSDVRKAAADALGKIGPTAVKAVPYIVKALANSDSDVRKAAADALEKIDPQWRQSEGTQSAISHFVKALANSDSDVRKAAADALGKIGPTAVKAVLHLVKALANSDDKSDVRKAAADALGKIGPTAVKAVPHLVKALTNSDDKSYVRTAAADALGKIGPTAVKAVPYLVKALANQSSKVHKAAANALEKIDPQWRQSEGTQSAIPHLVKALVAENNNYYDVQMDVVDALGEIGPTAVKAVHHIVKMLGNNPGLNSDYFVYVRRAIEKSLNKIDPTGEWRKQL